MQQLLVWNGTLMKETFAPSTNALTPAPLPLTGEGVLKTYVKHLESGGSEDPSHKAPGRGTLLRPLLLAVPAFLVVPAAHALDAVTLQLKWRHQFQFAGYYAAVEKGFYRDAGLEVGILEG